MYKKLLPYIVRRQIMHVSVAVNNAFQQIFVVEYFFSAEINVAAVIVKSKIAVFSLVKRFRKNAYAQPRAEWDVFYDVG